MDLGCTICKNAFNQSLVRIVALNCGHVFHLQCLDGCGGFCPNCNLYSGPPQLIQFDTVPVPDKNEDLWERIHLMVDLKLQRNTTVR